MNSILCEFNGSIERIRNNFYFSFLSINFINQKPFKFDIILPVNMKENIISAQSINSFDRDGVEEFGNSIRRHFLNDILIAYERYSMSMIASHLNGQVRIDPETLNDRSLTADRFEKLVGVYDNNDIIFFTQLRRLRNSIVHFNGHYSATNQLDYTFGTVQYSSNGNIGRSISIEYDNILWIYRKLSDIVIKGNANYHHVYPI